MSMNARITQNQAMTSLLTLELMEASASFAGAPFFVFTLIASAFTIHLNDEAGRNFSITAIEADALARLLSKKVFRESA